MPRAVRFDNYGGTEVLYVAEVEIPPPAAGQVRVKVRAAGINPGEAAIRMGALDDQWPATFPSGQGSDLAGVIESVFDEDGGWAAGDEVIGWTDRRASQAELAIVDADKLVRKRPASPGRPPGRCSSWARRRLPRSAQSRCGRAPLWLYPAPPGVSAP